MTDEHVERYGKAWEAGQREDRECSLCGNFIRPGQWMHYHYRADGSRAIEHVDCDHPEKHQDADYLQVTPPDTGEHRLNEAGELLSLGARDLTVPGSPEWCSHTIDLLKLNYQVLENRWGEVVSVLTELAEHHAWEEVPHDKPYGSVVGLLRAELGISKRQVDALGRLLPRRHKTWDERTVTRSRLLGKQPG